MPKKIRIGVKARKAFAKAKVTLKRKSKNIVRKPGEYHREHPGDCFDRGDGKCERGSITKPPHRAGDYERTKESQRAKVKAPEAKRAMIEKPCPLCGGLMNFGPSRPTSADWCQECRDNIVSEILGEHGERNDIGDDFRADLVRLMKPRLLDVVQLYREEVVT